MNDGFQLYVKFPKKGNKIRKPTIIYSHIWHINIPKCVKSVKVWWRYYNAEINVFQLCFKIPKNY